MKPYNPPIGYCNPSNSLLIKLIPDKLIGVNLNSCYYWHNVAYEAGGDERERRLADRRLKESIFDKFIAKWWVPLSVAWWIANRHYNVVRVFGVGSFNYTQPVLPQEPPTARCLRPSEDS